MRWNSVAIAVVVALCAVAFAASDAGLDPCGKIHIPIGIANSLDTLKTFVETEGCFSPGVGSYGVYFWLLDKKLGRLFSPTMEAVECEHGLADGRYLIPWAKWSAGSIEVTSEVCQVKRSCQDGDLYIVGSRVKLTNSGSKPADVVLYVALRPLGPAGFDVSGLSVSPKGDALHVDGHAAIVSIQSPSDSGVLATDMIGSFALNGEMPADRRARSPSGDCSGAMSFDLTLSPGHSRTLGFICPVLPGRRAAGHKWDGVSDWAQFDVAELNPSSGGSLQPYPGLDFYRGLDISELFAEAKDYWQRLTGKVKLDLPDKRWEDAFAAIIAHAAMEMNEGAPDVSVVNYNVFNRDGVYVANIFQKSGNSDLAGEAIDYFTRHPFNGRSYPEADNPGQILWAMAQQIKFTRDRAWARRIYPAARRIAEMIEYYRTTSGPHWVLMDGLDFGEELPEDTRRKLEPGRCDGHHPEYTQAFDITGLFGAASLAAWAGESWESHLWSELAEHLHEDYDRNFGGNLGSEYGDYCVLWPCRLYRLDGDKARQQFNGNGAQGPSGWRYFPLARAHQGLLAGNRQAGYGTLQSHLDHDQMRGWYAFDEGGKSGSGGWNRVLTTWNGNVAMPHGWAIAEFWLLLRDCLAFEDEKGRRLVLLSGVPPEWFSHADGIAIENMPTYFGRLDLRWRPRQGGATLEIGGNPAPASRFVLRLPASLNPRVVVGSQAVPASEPGEFTLSALTREAEIQFRP